MTETIERDEPPMVEVRMSANAAASLAEACRWAWYRAEDEMSNPELSDHERQKAERCYEWLSWGSRWLLKYEERQR